MTGELKVKNEKLKIGKSRTMRELGFTLVELLAVIMVIAVIGAVVGAIIISTLIGTNKTNSLESVRSSGNFALLQVAKTIEFARGFDGVSTDGVNYTQNCSTQSPPYGFIKVTSLQNETTVFSCGSPSSPTISSNSASLVDTTAVSVSSCFFTCTQDSIVVSPTIGINFTLSSKKPGSFVENKASIPFKTSVTMRNLNR